MAELLQERQTQVPQFTPTWIATFDAEQSNRRRSTLMHEKLTNVRMAAKKVLVSKGNDLQLMDLTAKDQNQFEVRRADTLCVKSKRESTQFETYDAKLSSDGLTVTSLKVADNGLQMIEVWDSGKGSICRVKLQDGQNVTAFLQERLVDKNFLFICLKERQGDLQVLQSFEIGKDGETCDHWLTVDLSTPTDLRATDLYLGAGALYVNMGSQCLFKLEIIQEMYENTFDDFTVIQRSLIDSMYFNLGAEDGVEVFKACELENTSDAWRHLGNSKDLLVVIFSDCQAMIFDQINGDKLKLLDQLPQPYTNNLTQLEMLDVRVIGDQLLVLAMIGVGQQFNGPVLIYLDEKLQYRVRASLYLNRDTFGLISSASIHGTKSVDIVSDNTRFGQDFKVTNLTVLSPQEAFLSELLKDFDMPRGADQKALMEQLLDYGLYIQMADLLLMQSQEQFVFTEKGALLDSINTRLRTQLNGRINLILQAIKKYSLTGITQTDKAQQERNAILQRIREEQDFVEGIETVYKGLLQMQTIVALNIQVDKNLDKMDLSEVQAIEATKTKIACDITKRRTILSALDFVTRTGFLICMQKIQEDFSKMLSDKSLLLYDMLRLAPIHFHESVLPLTTLEDVLSLFDAAEEDSYLAQAVMIYHLEAYNTDFCARADKKTETIDSGFIPRDVQKTVKSVYKLDRLLSDLICDQEQITAEVLNVLRNPLGFSKCGLIRSQALLVSLLKSRFGKEQLEAALYVVSDTRSLENAHYQNQLEEFIEGAIRVFTRLSKPAEGFQFLASVESRAYTKSPAYTSGIESLIDHIISLSRQDIERKFLSLTFTDRQEAAISSYLGSNRPDLQIVREFWMRRPVKGVGMSIKLNWNDETNAVQIKEIRQEAVRFYTGIGSNTKDGIFTYQQKLAAKHASGLTSDALEMYNTSVGLRQDDEMMQEGNEEREVDLHVTNQLLMLSLTEPYEALRRTTAEELNKPASLSSYFFGNIQEEPNAATGGFDLLKMAVGSSGKRSSDLGQTRLFSSIQKIPTDPVDQQFYNTNTKVSEQQIQEQVRNYEHESHPFDESAPSFAEEEQSSLLKHEPAFDVGDREMQYKEAYTGPKRNQSFVLDDQKKGLGFIDHQATTIREKSRGNLGFIEHQKTTNLIQKQKKSTPQTLGLISNSSEFEEDQEMMDSVDQSSRKEEKQRVGLVIGQRQKGVQTRAMARKSNQ